MKGYGDLIRLGRIKEGMDAPADLARLLVNPKTGKPPAKALIYRFEAELQEPTIDYVNQLAARLPFSVETLLKAMGASLANGPDPVMPKALKELLPLLSQLQGAEFASLEVAAHALIAMRGR